VPVSVVEVVLPVVVVEPAAPFVSETPEGLFVVVADVVVSDEDADEAESDAIVDEAELDDAADGAELDDAADEAELVAAVDVLVWLVVSLETDAVTTPLLKSCSFEISIFIGSIESDGSLQVTVLVIPILVAVTSAEAPSAFFGCTRDCTIVTHIFA
jgi:hypothetical protein